VPQFGDLLSELLLRQLVIVLFEDTSHRSSRCLVNSQEENKLSETNETIAVGVSILHYCGRVILNVGIDSLSLHQLALIVRCEAIKEVTVAHLGLAFLVFLGGEDLKNFFGGSEESNLVLVVAADTVRSRRLTQIRIFLPASNVKSQYSWSHQ